MKQLIDKTLFKLSTNSLSKEQNEFMGIMLSKFPYVIIGGSVALEAYGLLYRRVGDLDFIIPQSKRGFVHNKLTLDILNYDTNIVLNKLTSRGKTHIEYQYGKVRFCVFYEPDENIEYYNSYYGNDKIKIHDYQSIINYKKLLKDQKVRNDDGYLITSASKHRSDLAWIEEREGDLNNRIKLHII